MLRNWDALLAPGRTLIMGILNANTDSFFDPSRVSSAHLDVVVERAQRMVADGADILDIGAESSRPGAVYVSTEEELSRLLPVLEAVRAAVAVPLSVDTRKSKVATLSLRAGADIINDISAGEDDDEMFSCVAGLGSPMVLMHKHGVPETMQQAPQYSDVLGEVTQYLLARAALAKKNGVPHIVIDPGIGFGKTFEDNIALVAGVASLVGHGYPVLLGHSRKSFIGRALGKGDLSLPAEDRLFGTVGVSCFGAQRGVRIVRVHDVKANADALHMVSLISETQPAKRSPMYA